LAYKTKQPTTSGQKFSEAIINATKGGRQLTAEEYFNLANQILGPIGKGSIPEGSQILSENAAQLVYRDPQGYTHTVSRDLDANTATFGQTREQTDRPDVLPLTKQIPGLDTSLQSAIQAVNRSFSNQGQLATLPPEVLAELDAQSAAERSDIEQQANKAQGNLIASLYGRGMNESSLANSAATELSEAIARTFLQEQSVAAQRKLDLQKFLSELGLNTGSLAQSLISSITGQETQRATTSAQIGLGRDQLNEQALEAARNFQLEYQKFQEQLKAQDKGKLGGILSAVASIGLAPLTGGTSLAGLATGALGNLFKTPPYVPSGTGTPFGLG
jgi:hypothetical protein